MTTLIDMEIVCSVCEEKSTQPVVGSMNQFGPPDLDFRPGEMYRSTIGTWVMECPNCGYVAVTLENELNINKKYLKSEEYQTCDGINFKSELSKRFYKEYLIASKKDNKLETFYSIINCIWSCDDAHDIENAKYTRQIAIKLADEIIENEENTEQIFVRKADFLRRIGEFDQLLKEYGNITINDEMLDKIIKFQVKKAYEKDDKCYNLDYILK